MSTAEHSMAEYALSDIPGRGAVARNAHGRRGAAFYGGEHGVVSAASRKESREVYLVAKGFTG